MTANASTCSRRIRSTPHRSEGGSAGSTSCSIPKCSDRSLLAPVALCRFDGALLSVPRLVDVRVLWARSDRIVDVPDTWAQLLDSEIVFGFPGRESGLFGTFFELVTGAGGALFDDEAVPTMDTPEAEWAIEALCQLGARAPADLPDWHYDGVDVALLSGRVDAAAAWPGAWGAIRASPHAASLEPFRYPAGTAERVSYSGCHSWGIPTTCGDLDRAIALVTDLAGFAAQRIDASGGNICSHRDALASVEPADDRDRRRLEITRATIEDAMITYPSLARFPEVEDAGWSAIREALRGSLTARETVHEIQGAAVAALM